jgi:hypothetical protein
MSQARACCKEIVEAQKVQPIYQKRNAAVFVMAPNLPLAMIGLSLFNEAKRD